MQRWITTAAMAMLLYGCDAPSGKAGTADASAVAPAEAQQSALVPDSFAPPTRVEGEGFVLVPLGPSLVQIDYEAYMSSIDHLQRTFTRSTSWPTTDITDDDAIKDMENEQRRFQARESFAYAVLTPDGTRERGCVYVRPSSKPGYDAVVRMWVTQAEYDAGFDSELQDWVTRWVSTAWPFDRVAYPGRIIDWATWDALPDA
ncbi:MAG: hypothetical protein V2I63_03000 [Pseudomonadales bacterium]|jgi:hypothetical protein|nr:hypothetical protein [Pseudomonadales bacterium]